MSKDRHHRLHELFTAAVELPADQRDDWLQEECAGDHALLTELRALLAEDQRSQDPLEAGVRQVLRQRGNGPDGDETISRTSLLDDFDIAKRRDELPDSDLSSDEFCGQLSEIDVLSGDELVKWLESVQPPETREDPQALARQLITEGKLTEFQASVLLGGKSKKLLIDKYLILDLLDSGGMGMVFKAVHRTMKRVVALKMLPPGRFSSPAAVQRFRREVEVAATLEHPNIVTAHDADESKGVHFLVMEYARGRDLYKKVTADGPLSVAQAVQCVLQAAAGLQHAHEKGIIHRDIKPGNLILADTKTIKILDLGLASIGDRTEPKAGVESERRGDQLTRSGSLLGTVAYMAPEQAVDSANVDARCDIYALGCTFYFLLTGETPYGSDPVKSIDRHQTAEIPGLRDKRPDVPAAVDTIYHKMLAKDPNDRQHSMAELIAALKVCKLPESNRNETREPKDGRGNSSGVGHVGTRHSMERKRGRRESGKDREIRVSSRTRRAAVALIGATVIGLMSVMLLRNPTSDSPPPAPAPELTTPSDPNGPPPLAIAPFDAEQARQHQQSWAEYLRVPVEFTNSIGMKFVLIPPGEFVMGSLKTDEELTGLILGAPAARQNEQRAHPVRISQPFYLGRTEVTQAQWRTVIKTSPWKDLPSAIDGPDYPATSFGWIGADEFCSRLNELEGADYRMPTESQWEFACRAGTETLYHFGDTPAEISEYAWHAGNTKAVGNDSIQPVGLLDPNSWGLFDMHGNAQEICQDWFSIESNDLSAESSTPLVDPTGPETGERKLIRGGSWRDRFQWLRSSIRLRHDENSPHQNEGFRVVLSVESVQSGLLSEDAPPAAITPFDEATAKQHQQAWAEYLGVPMEKELDLLGGEKLKFVLIPPGEYWMGSAKSKAELVQVFVAGNFDGDDEWPRHRVRISNAFYLSTTVVTRGQWTSVMDTAPWEQMNSLADGPDYPATHINWHNATEFCRRLTEQHGQVHRLPTEAEWEYACRAGTTTIYGFGDKINDLKDYAWFYDSATMMGEEYAHQVGVKLPNAWGLYDMHGNVWEWCADVYVWDFYAWDSGTDSISEDPVGPAEDASNSMRVLRGGSWYHHAAGSRSADRSRQPSTVRADNTHGLRVALSVESVQSLAFDAEQARQHQLAWAERLNVPISKELDLGGGQKLAMVLIPPGEFWMGSDKQERESNLIQAQSDKAGFAVQAVPSEGPRHRVRITKPFWLSRNEITRGQFRRFVEDTRYPFEQNRNARSKEAWSSSEFLKLENHPATLLSHADALAFSAWLTKLHSEIEFSLPTEAQWEYACRAGTATRWSFGNQSKSLADYAWFNENSGLASHPVGELQPNAFGLHDMHGNVWEWCADWYSPDYYASSPLNDQPGPSSGDRSRIVRRGGGWDSRSENCRSAFRLGMEEGPADRLTGFRLAAAIDLTPSKDVPRWVKDDPTISSLKGINDQYEWTEPIRLPDSVNSMKRDALPALSGDGKILIFLSAREGDLGRGDLWMSPRGIFPSLAARNLPGCV